MAVNIPVWKMAIINEIKQKLDQGEKLTFIHSPKCAGIFAEGICAHFNIASIGHCRAKKKDGKTFTIIREPAARFESLLNYRLTEKAPRQDWPHNLKHVYHDKSLSLNYIIENMSDSEITGFRPYRTLKYWSENIDLLLTIEEFIPTLKIFGFKITKKFPKKNVSIKDRGYLSEDNRQRIRELYQEDVQLYNQWTRLDKRSIDLSRVVITGVGRNIESYLPRVFMNIEKISKYFSSSIVIICESGSTDNTREELLSWQSTRSDTHILTASASDPHHIERIIEARNTVLSYIEDNYAMDYFEYLINLDLDNIITNIDGVVDSMSYPNWDVICSIGICKQRQSGDLFAMRTKIYPNNLCSINEKLKHLSNRCGHHRLNIMNYLCKTDQEKLLNNELVEVKSAFGGLGIYKYAIIHGLRYNTPRFSIEKLKYKDIKESENVDYDLDCEHVNFHQQILDRGGRICINALLCTGGRDIVRKVLNTYKKKIKKEEIKQGEISQEKINRMLRYKKIKRKNGRKKMVLL